MIDITEVSGLVFSWYMSPVISNSNPAECTVYALVQTQMPWATARVSKAHAIGNALPCLTLWKWDMSI